MWAPLVPSAAGAAAPPALARFGHTATALTGPGGEELVVVYGGVAASGAAGAASVQQVALGDVLALSTATGEWRTPQAAPGGPGPRAFHCAAALGPSQLAVFGGHILTLDAGGRKRRVFHHDVWTLDVVSGRPVGAVRHIRRPGKGRLPRRPRCLLPVRHEKRHCLPLTRAAPRARAPRQAAWRWERVDPAPGSPTPPKRDTACLLALGRGRLLLFGGRSEQQRALNDTWLFDLARCARRGRGLGVWGRRAARTGAPRARRPHT